MKNGMKRIVAIMMILCMILMMGGCKGSAGNGTNDGAVSDTAATGTDAGQSGTDDGSGQNTEPQITKDPRLANAEPVTPDPRLSGAGGSSGQSESTPAVDRPVTVSAPLPKIEGSSLYVEKVENLPDNFIFGMDSSAVLAEEASGVKYYGFDGTEQDVFKTLAEAGVNYIRVRVWNNPFDSEGHGYGGGNCDINVATEIGKRATKYGMRLLVDFHYSDFWADPGKQMVPLAWKDMDIETKSDALYRFTLDCLNQLKDAGVDVGMVQVGNETNGSMCGEKTWMNIQYLMKAGSKATREVFPDALVAVHFANPEKSSNYKDYAKKLAYYDVDYDVFGSSYYPYWHGTLDNLAQILSFVAEEYGKKVMVLETSYAYTPYDTDFNGNTISDGGAVTKTYPYTVQGQASSVRSIVDTLVNDTKNAIGICYWEGTWITVGGSSFEENSALWEKYGSGWATSYAAVYDPKDAGKYYGGCAVDNQALFDAEGKPLESLKIFNLMRYGNEIAPKADALEDVTLYVDLAAEIELPETVNAILTDDSKSAIPVTWNVTDADLAKMHTGGPAKYDVTGEADGMTAHCYVNMIEFNFIDDYSFETGKLGKWAVTDLASSKELYLENKPTDSLTGDWHMHFWSPDTDSVKFTMEQKVEGLNAGKYKFGMSIMGGDCGETDIYLYVKINGEIVAKQPMTITSYGNWDTQMIRSFEYDGSSELIVGIYVQAAGAGNGAWGKIDDALLNSVTD
ncbi:MAG: glycosyl hydrolase 53 family protein [Lachnospiraceae bacterium]|nr:glycosyl hydrolase 53 family protein [Lachnospiraceae bacterium]